MPDLNRDIVAMTEPGSSSQAAPRRPATSRRMHVVCYVVLAGLLAYVLVARYVRPLFLGDSITIEQVGGADRASPNASFDRQQVEQRIDPNVATWAELARLPDMGEITAKRIVAYRQERLADQDAGEPTSQVVFRRPADLDPVRGIGPKTLEKIAPYLKFDARGVSEPR